MPGSAGDGSHRQPPHYVFLNAHRLKFLRINLSRAATQAVQKTSGRDSGRSATLNPVVFQLDRSHLQPTGSQKHITDARPNAVLLPGNLRFKAKVRNTGGAGRSKAADGPLLCSCNSCQHNQRQLSPQTPLSGCTVRASSLWFTPHVAATQRFPFTSHETRCGPDFPAVGSWLHFSAAVVGVSLPSDSNANTASYTTGNLNCVTPQHCTITT